MSKFIPYDYNQSSMVVINFEEQLQPVTFEHALHHLIDNKLDLSIFYPGIRNDETGRPAYDPAILLKIVLFAYSRGITSSREIEWQCTHNIIFKALSCDTVPHFTTIANFVSDRHEAVSELFEQIVLICHEQGLLGNELIAIDGCKMPSNAAKEWSGTFGELEQKRDKIKRQIAHLLSEHQRLDQSDTREDARRKRTEQTLETLNAASDRIEQFLKCNSPRMGQGKRAKEVKSNITDNESAKMTTSKGTIQGYNGLAAVDKKHQIIVDAQAFGEGQEQHSLQPIAESIRSRYRRLGIRKDLFKGRYKPIITADTGFASEQNMRYLYEHGVDAYIPDHQFQSRDPRFENQKRKYGKRHQQGKQNPRLPTFSASEFRFDPAGRTCHCPAGEQLSLRGERNDAQGHRKIFFAGRLSQCRNCEKKHQCMPNPAAAGHRKGKGRQVSFILERTPSKASYTDWMKQRIDSARGKQIYSHRISVVEPVFGNLGNNKGLNRFSLRSKAKVQGQWRLYCMVHNIEKLANYGRLTR